MVHKTRIFLSTLLLLLAAGNAQAQKESVELPNWNIKTNLLWDATATISLGAEFRIGEKTSIDLPLNYNIWTFDENRKWKQFLVQPELRWWTKETFRSHFFGLHSHYVQYNVGNLPKPFSPHMQAHRFEGWLAGAGVSYGYRWNINHRWALEATVGAGYAYLSYDKFPCFRCGKKIESDTKHYFGPTRAGITLIFGIGEKVEKPLQVPEYIIPSTPVIAREVKPEPIIPKETKPAPAAPYEPVFRVSFVVPEVETVKARDVSGKAYLDFAVGRSEIVPTFRNNAAELEKIHATIESVKNDPDVTITGITITGYTSPEGTWASNKTLSEQRARVLKDHIASVHGLRANRFKAEGRGEDWNGLDSLVARSSMTDKYQILEIIRGTDIFDGRESKLMMLSGGNPYREMAAEFFPELRRTDYSIAYTVAPLTIERGKEVFRLRPGNLALNEMYLIANTYKQGSDAFNEVFEMAAWIYSENDVANINAAASALNRKAIVAAALYLGRVEKQTEAYWNNKGLLECFQGNTADAAACFAKGGELGRANAKEMEKYLTFLELR